jgi:hypothetical protein
VVDCALDEPLHIGRFRDIPGLEDARAPGFANLRSNLLALVCGALGQE